MTVNNLENSQLITVAQAYGIKHWLSTPLSSAKRLLLEKFFGTYKQHMMELRRSDDEMRKLVLQCKTYYKNAEKAFKQRKYIDVAHWVGQINLAGKQIIGLGKAVAALKDEQLAEHFGQYSDADIDEDYFKAAEALTQYNSFIKEAGFVSDVFKGVSRRFLESLYWKDTKQRKEAVEKLLSHTEEFVERLNKSLNKMGYARASGNISDWLKELNDVVSAHLKFERKFKEIYDKDLLPLIQNVKLQQQQATKLEEKTIQEQEKLKGQSLTEAEKQQVRKVIEDAISRMQKDTATPGAIETTPEAAPETPQEVRKQYVQELLQEQQEKKEEPEEEAEPIPLTREKEEEAFPLTREKKRNVPETPEAPVTPDVKPGKSKRRGRPSREDVALRNFEKSLRDLTPSQEELQRINEEQAKNLREALEKENKAVQKLEEAELPVEKETIEQSTENKIEKAKSKVEKAKKERAEKTPAIKRPAPIAPTPSAPTAAPTTPPAPVKPDKTPLLTLLAYPKDADEKDVRKKMKQLRKSLSHRVEGIMVDKVEHVKKMFENQGYMVDVISLLPEIKEETPSLEPVLEPTIPEVPVAEKAPEEGLTETLQKELEPTPTEPKEGWDADSVFAMYSDIVNKFGDDFYTALPKDTIGKLDIAKLKGLPGIGLLPPASLRLLFGLDRVSSEKMSSIEEVPLSDEELEKLVPMFDPSAWQKPEGEPKVANEIEHLMIKTMNQKFMQELLKIAGNDDPYMIAALLAKYSEVMEDYDEATSIKLLEMAKNLLHV